MKIAMPCNDDKESLCIVFGRAPYFAVYDTEKRAFDFVDNTAKDEQGGAGIKAAQVVLDSGADVLITLRLGENSAEVLKEGDVKIFKADKEAKSIEENFELFLQGKLDTLVKFHEGYHGIK